LNYNGLDDERGVGFGGRWRWRCGDNDWN